MIRLKKLPRKYLWWALAVPVALVLLVQLYYFVRIGWWVRHNPDATRFMQQQLAEIQKRRPKAKLKHRWVPYRQISSNLKRAIIASEDANFVEHGGIDWDAIAKAMEKNAKKGKVVAGGSTITQQLAKNLFLSGSRSYVRKIQEIPITYMLEYWMSKKRILEIYLNVVEFGTGVFGAEAAAQHYYHLHAAELSPEQAARLAVMLPRPRVYEKKPDSEYLASRTAFVLEHMFKVALP
jgi:monofunctional biosynthetic peptidoglycan transglycosylase